MCGLLCSAILSPLSPSAALLTVLQPGLSELSQVGQSLKVTQHPVSSDAPADDLVGLPDVVSRVLGVVFDMMEDDGEERTYVLLMMILIHVHVQSLELISDSDSR